MEECDEREREISKRLLPGAGCLMNERERERGRNEKTGIEAEVQS
jgi:hypothetical protein